MISEDERFEQIFWRNHGREMADYYSGVTSGISLSCVFLESRGERGVYSPEAGTVVTQNTANILSGRAKHDARRRGRH
jgi:hypothetical protein